MELVLISILVVALLLLPAEALHCMAFDWQERRAVQNALQGCLSVARASAPSWTGERALRHETYELYRALSRSKPGLPAHLVGTPASELIRRYA